MERLERAYPQLEGFNADVAHELRTPLATLIGQTEVALSRERSPEALRETLLSNLEELQRLSAMVNDMLFLSRADRGAQARRGGRRAWPRWPRRSSSSTRPRSPSAGCASPCAATPRPGRRAAVQARGLQPARQRDPLRRPGSEIVVQIAAEEPEQVHVLVQNDGPPIAPPHLPRLFDRFFRADGSRSAEQVHHGLGLSIVAAIARMHSGRTSRSPPAASPGWDSPSRRADAGLGLVSSLVELSQR